MLDPATIMSRLEAIEADLATRQNTLAEAAGQKARLIRDVEHAQAIAYAKAQGNTTDRRMIAQAEVGNSQEYAELTQWESTYEAARSAVMVLQARATIGQTLLRTMREAA